MQVSNEKTHTNESSSTIVRLSIDTLMEDLKPHVGKIYGFVYADESFLKSYSRDAETKIDTIDFLFWTPSKIVRPCIQIFTIERNLWLLRKKTLNSEIIPF